MPKFKGTKGKFILIKVPVVALILTIQISILHPLCAQELSGSISGTVADVDGNPCPGTTVTLQGSSLMNPLTYVTTGGGKFRFHSIPPGKGYVLACDVPGFQTYKHDEVEVHVGKNIEFKIILIPDIRKEEISVTAPSPLIDAKNTKLDIIYSNEFFQKIPLNRDYYSIINSAPGIISDENEFLRSFSSHGSTVRNNKVALEGINLTDPIIGLNSVGIPFDALEEVVVQTGGHSAEIGMTDGAYVNIITKSGGDRFQGQLNYMFFNRRMIKDIIPEPELREAGLTRPTGYKMFSDYSFSLGGPLAKHKIWFFTNMRLTKWTVERETLPDGVCDLVHDEFMLLAKLTYMPHPNLKITGMFNMGNIDEPLMIRSPFPSAKDYYYTAKEGLHKIDNQRNFALFLATDWVVNQDTLMNLRLNYFGYYIPLRLQPELDPYTPTSIDLGTNIWSGSPGTNEDYDVKRFQASVGGTKYIYNFLSCDHEVKAGLELEFDDFSLDWWKKNPFWHFTYYEKPWGLMNFAPYWGLFYAFTFGANEGDVVYRSQLRRLGGYIQDSFTVMNRITFNLGIRVDLSRGDVLGGEFTPAGSADLLLTTLAPSVFQNMIFGDNKGAIIWKDISPRLGLTFDLFNDKTTIIKASWSRYNEFLIMQYFMNLTPYPSHIKSYWWDDNRNGIIDSEDNFQPFYIPPDSKNFALEDELDPAVKSPLMDELIFGIERELSRDLSMSIHYIYKIKSRIVEDVEKFRGYTPESAWWKPFAYNDPGGDGEFGTDDDNELIVYGLKKNAPGSQLWLTNPVGAERKYRAFEVVVNKRWSKGWQFLASMTLSKLEGNIDTSFAATTSLSEAFNSPNWSINRYGRLLSDIPLLIKIQGSFRLPFGFFLSGLYSYMSGGPWVRILRVQLPFDSTIEFPGSFVDVNAEPPGKQRHQSKNNLDLRIEKSFKLQKTRTFHLSFDIINILGDHGFILNRELSGTLYADGNFEKWPLFGEEKAAYGKKTIKFSARLSF